jgi:hypothetical protein
LAAVIAARAVGIGLRRPDGAAVGLLPVGLLVVDPPVGGHGSGQELPRCS